MEVMVVRRLRFTEVFACIVFCAFVAVVIASSVFMYRREQELKNMPPKPPITTQASTAQTLIPNPYIKGPKDAKVLIKAFLPFEVDCHMINIGFLIDVANAEQKRIRLELYNMHSPEGSREMEKHHAHCATILVNGREASEGPMSNVIGMIQLLDEELKKAYGSGLSQSTIKHLQERWTKVTTKDAANLVVEMLGKKKEMTSGVAVAKRAEKVEVVFFMPPKDTPAIKNFPEAVERVRKLQEQHTNKLSMRIVGMMSDEAKKALNEGRIEGPCVLVNGSQKHLVKVGKESKVISLDVDPLKGKFINPDDVETVVKAYLGELQPQP